MSREARGGFRHLKKLPLLAAWCLVPALAAAALRGLWAPDEPRYAEIAREIVRSGDWLQLRLAGEAYPDKPPLLFWLLAGLGAGKVPDFALRLPALCATAATAWATSRIARAHGCPSVARAAPWMLLSMALPLFVAGRVQIDPLLTLGTTLAIGLVTNPATLSRRGHALALAGIATGLAALAKGPVAWLIVGLVIFAAPRRALTSPLRTRLVAGLPGILLATLPLAAWALAVIWYDPALTEELLYGEHAARLFAARSHPGPVWEPTVELLALTLPWTPLVLLGARDAIRPDAPRLQRLALRWLLVLLIAFSISAEKRNLYLLPAYPAAALLAAGSLHRIGRWIALLPLSSAVVLLTSSLLALGPFQETLTERLPAGADLPYYGLLLATLTTLGAVHVARAGSARRRATRLAAWHTATALGLALCLVPAVDSTKSARQFARDIATQQAVSRSPLRCVGVRPAAYRYYGNLDARPDPRGMALHAELSEPGRTPQSSALISTAHLLVVEPEALAELRLRSAASVGSRHVLWLTTP